MFCKRSFLDITRTTVVIISAVVAFLDIILLCIFLFEVYQLILTTHSINYRFTLPMKCRTDIALDRKLPYWPLNARPLGTNFFLLNFWSSGPGKKRPGNMGPVKIKGRLKRDRAKLNVKGRPKWTDNFLLFCNIFLLHYGVLLEGVTLSVLSVSV